MSETIIFRVKPEFKEMLKKAAEGEGVSMSDVIRGALKPVLDEREAELWDTVNRVVKVVDKVLDRIVALDEKVDKLMVMGSHTSVTPCIASEPKAKGGQDVKQSSANPLRCPAPKKSGALYNYIC